MEGDFIHINQWLRPLAWLYGLGVGLRNLMFDIGLLPSRAFDVPVIAVGNITVGGTGKTPHVEYLVRLLQGKASVAVLSRGYKRKSRGYVQAGDSSTARDIGDEPLQMHRKFPGITVAVDRSRCHGIDNLMGGGGVDVVLLDDAFQHRYVQAGINIMLVDYHRLVIYDELLPAGRLREPLSAKNRADIVIVTKCPADLKPMDFRVLTKAMNLYPYQQLYFSTIAYADRLPQLFGGDGIGLDELQGRRVVLLTGIASPRQMIEDLTPRVGTLVPLTFGDHHNFRQRDAEAINHAWQQGSAIITTEKDATRLQALQGLDEQVRQSIYVLPVVVRFMLGQEQDFNEKIIGYVRKNSRNSVLVKAKDASRAKNGDNTRDGTRTISFRNN